MKRAKEVDLLGREYKTVGVTDFPVDVLTELQASAARELQMPIISEGRAVRWAALEWAKHEREKGND